MTTFGKCAPPSATLEDAILDAIFTMIVISMVEVSTVPLRRGKAAAARPRAWPLSRLDGLQGSEWTTSPDHSVVSLDAVCSALLPFLDGDHDREALRQKLLAITQEGRIPLVDALKVAAKDHVILALDKLAAAGLLE